MKIAIVDDEQQWIELAKKQVMDYWKQDVEIFTYPSGKTFLDAKETFDFILMDIEMPEMDGFDTVKEYRKWSDRGLLMILTTHTEMSRKGYQVDAFRYIDKLQMQEELQEAFSSAQLRLQGDKRVLLPIKNGGEIEIPLKKIIYFEVVLRAVKLRTDTEEYTCMEQISKLEKQLKQDGFFMPHRSYLLNFQWVQSFTNNEIVMKNGDKLSLSRRKYKEWKIAYFEWKFDRANG